MHRFKSFSQLSRYFEWPFPILFSKRNSSENSKSLAPDNVAEWVKNTVQSSALILFSKTTCPYCLKTKDTLSRNKIKHATIELDKLQNEAAIKETLSTFSNIKTVPQLYSRGKFIGDCSTILGLDKDGTLIETVSKSPHDYDLVVIGGGSGGLSASKEAAKFGAKVAVLDYVDPTPKGTTWGLGGTCVNVGCIPKKLMHQAALIRHAMEDAPNYGWEINNKDVKHNWETMVNEIQSYIKSLNWGYRTALRSNSVDYLNAKGSLIDEHTVRCTSKNGEVKDITASKIILATGERPRYPNIPGDKEYAITSDDLFSLPYKPGKTLVIGASYVALECAGFLHTLGEDTTVMVRSIFLRGFDQQMADLVGLYMENHGTKFVRSCVPTSIEQIKPVDLEAKTPGLLRVKGEYTDGSKFEGEFNTVILAIGRDPDLKAINVPAIGVKLDKAGRVICTDDDKSNLDSIYAIGDINSGKPQLTPVAIQAGRCLARRLFAGATELAEYDNVATTVFTPLEYGACGLSEEDAIARYGRDNIEIYHSNFKPLEWTVAHREDNFCYCKLICLKSENNRVLGLHILGPNAGEITQGYAVAIKMKATKADFDRTIGIHPTCSEIFTTLHVTKSSGASAKVTGC